MFKSHSQCVPELGFEIMPKNRFLITVPYTGTFCLHLFDDSVKVTACVCPGWVAQFIGVLSHTGSIPSQGTYLGCGLDSQSGCIWEETDRCFSLPSSLSQINEHILR